MLSQATQSQPKPANEQKINIDRERKREIEPEQKKPTKKRIVENINRETAHPKVERHNKRYFVME